MNAVDADMPQIEEQNTVTAKLSAGVECPVCDLVMIRTGDTMECGNPNCINDKVQFHVPTVM